MKVQVQAALMTLNTEEQVQWMQSLGELLTISARSSYPFEENPGSIRGLMGFNEIQHRLFARIRDLPAGHEWTLESFVQMIAETSETYDIKGDVCWAFNKSLPSATIQ